MKAGNNFYYHRHLPHYQPPDATYFITFRLAGTLPAHACKRLQGERRLLHERLVSTRESDFTVSFGTEYQTHLFNAFEQLLDGQACGPRWLAVPSIATIVHEAIRFRNGREYQLFASCIMPNHVHLLIAIGKGDQPIERPLFRILQSLKRYTAREANKILTRFGKFWQEESYDHVVRDEKELRSLLWYVLFNPVKAGLVMNWEDWRWTYVHPDFVTK